MSELACSEPKRDEGRVSRAADRCLPGLITSHECRNTNEPQRLRNRRRQRRRLKTNLTCIESRPGFWIPAGLHPRTTECFAMFL